MEQYGDALAQNGEGGDLWEIKFECKFPQQMTNVDAEGCGTCAASNAFSKVAVGSNGNVNGNGNGQFPGSATR